MDWKDIIEKLLLVLSGSLLPSLWNKVLNRGKEKRDAKSGRISDCQKSIDILSAIITKLEAEVKRVETQMHNMEAVNRTHEESLKNQIRQLREVNEIQTEQIDALNKKIGELIMEREKSTKNASKKATTSKTKKAPRKSPRKAVL